MEVVGIIATRISLRLIATTLRIVAQLAGPSGVIPPHPKTQTVSRFRSFGQQFMEDKTRKMSENSLG